ncbi:copper amine oxidase N-terminal domain-containing protein [bacterium]|nr:copper amine oxidase N-terminal domain-containing protein [bacterium]
MFKKMNLSSLTVVLVLLVAMVFPFTSYQSVGSAEKAVPEDTYFTPLEAGKAAQVYFYFKNLSKKESTLSAKITVKDFPKGNEQNWFTQFCYSNICFLDEGTSPNKVKNNATEEMHVTLYPYTGAKVGEKIRIVLEVWPTREANLKTTLTFYGIVVKPSNIKLVIDKKNAVVGGKDITLDVPPMIISGRTMVPLRFIGEALSAEILWDNATRKVTYVLGDLSAFFWIDKKEAMVKIGPVYQRTIPLDAAPIIKNSRTLVPVRYVGEILGAEVGWEASTRTVTILFPKPSKE